MLILSETGKLRDFLAPAIKAHA